MVWIQALPLVGSCETPTQIESKVASSSTTDPFLSSSGPATEEEVTRPIDQDRAKAVTRKRKLNEGSSNQSEFSSALGVIMFTLEKLITSFAKSQLWKQYNKLNYRSIVNIVEKELENHRVPLRIIQTDLQFVQWNTANVEDEDDK
jgi:hypothetical protein